MGNTVALPEFPDTLLKKKKKSKMAVGLNSNEITDEILDFALKITNKGKRQMVALTFMCRNLPWLDEGSKSDAFCVLWQVDKLGDKTKLGQTEVISNNLNPKFEKEIVVDYYFQKQQNMRLEVYYANEPNEMSNLRKQ